MDGNKVEKLTEKQKLDTVTVWELMGNNFYVPDYQRGYRWTEAEVTKLLDDLFDYKEEYDDDKTFYCMQPLVVYFNEKEDAWEVIDGQQRLTTLFLLLSSDSDILRKIGKNNSEIYKLRYASRLDSEVFLSPEHAEDDKNIAKYIKLLSERKDIKDEIDLENFSFQNDNVDYYHICNALKAISDYIKTKDIDSENFLEKILNIKNKPKEPTVKFVWYDVTKEIKDNQIDSEEIFSRLNVGKISLTNAELIKALFLNRIDKELKDFKDNDSIKLQIAEPQKTKISSDWDMIEHSLLDPDFWSFIYGDDDGKYDTRIEFLFDMIQGKNIEHKDEEYFTFDKYTEDFRSFDKENNNDNSVSKRWKEVTDRFYLYKNWYENKELFHLIGFLRYKKVSIEEITRIQELSESNSDFIIKLRQWCVKLALLDDKEFHEFNSEEFLAVRKTKDEKTSFQKELNSFISEKLSSINYDDNYNQIKDTLLLFNILSSLDCEKESVRFSFKDYYNENWDVEHVRSQTDKGLTGSDRVDWILTNLGYFSGIPFPFEKKMSKTQKEEYISNMLNDIEKELTNTTNETIIEPTNEYPEGIDAATIINGLIELLKDKKETISLENSNTYKMINDGIIHEKNSSLRNKNGIHNLVLLDQGTNRGYKNTYFPVKRKWLNSREKNGIYILPCTKNVFSKTYSSKLFDLMNWSDYDADKYLEEIKRCLTNNLSI